ncbi:hypothetical protein V6N12_026813 [Hibiscus sabdariffa]|uniref:F-box domain-containing protein n=1 Tax=Hibiscus sabdariffa TaxID=183260 RepID=A0ABR2DSU8_9ROSI
MLNVLPISPTNPTKLRVGNVTSDSLHVCEGSSESGTKNVYAERVATWLQSEPSPMFHYLSPYPQPGKDEGRSTRPVQNLEQSPLLIESGNTSLQPYLDLRSGSSEDKYRPLSLEQRISNLSDNILCHILSFIPTKDAVQTSVVSTRWRYLFAYMSTLDFQYCLSNICSRLGAESFKNFVDRLLFFFNHLTLECFRLYESSLQEDDYSRLYGWICAALWRGVKEIDLRYKLSTVLPTFLFTSQSLMTLKLDINDDMKVPCKVCLPNLKSLRLRNIKFSDGDSIQRLISGCLALEDLVMDLQELPANINKFNIHSLSLKRLALDFGWMFTDSRIDFNYTFAINAPNLVYIKYAGPIAEVLCLSTMDSLEKADVEVYRLDNEASDDVNRESGATVTVSNLLQRICNVKSLRLAVDQPETLVRMPPDPVLGFHKLVELELKIQTEYHDWQGTWVLQFLYSVPNLQTLHLDLKEDSSLYQRKCLHVCYFISRRFKSDTLMEMKICLK